VFAHVILDSKTGSGMVSKQSNGAGNLAKAGESREHLQHENSELREQIVTLKREISAMKEDREHRPSR